MSKTFFDCTKGSRLQFFLYFSTAWMLINPKGSPSIIWYFATNWIFKKPKGFPFYNLRHCKIFENDYFFVSKFGSLRIPARYIRIFQDRRFFWRYATCSQFDFIEALSIFTRNETCCEHRGLLHNATFSDFLLFSVGEKWLQSLIEHERHPLALWVSRNCFLSFS